MKFLLLAVVVLAAATLPFASAEVSASEISSIDYSAMIGGPLTAIIKAQALAARTTVDFMRKVGLTSDNKVINAQFYYNITNATTGERKLHKLSVPLLTIIPIPYIRVHESTIEFNAKLTSVSQTSVDLSIGAEAGLGGGGDVKAVSCEISASFSSQLSVSNSGTEEREFTMKIFVKAVQDDMPAGLSRVLSMLESAIGVRRKDEEAAAEE